MRREGRHRRARRRRRARCRRPCAAVNPKHDDEQRYEHDAAARGEQSRDQTGPGNAGDDDRCAVDQRVRSVPSTRSCVGTTIRTPTTTSSRPDASRSTSSPTTCESSAPTITVGTAARTASRATRRSSTPARRYCRAPRTAEEHGGKRRRDRDRSGHAQQHEDRRAERRPARPEEPERRSRCRRRRGPRGSVTRRHRPPCPPRSPRRSSCELHKLFLWISGGCASSSPWWTTAA